MNLFFLIAFLFLSIVFGFPIFWQIEQPVRDAFLRFMWEAINFLLLAGFVISYSRVSVISILILTVLVFSVLAKKKAAGAKNEDLKVDPVRAAVRH